MIHISACGAVRTDLVSDKFSDDGHYLASGDISLYVNLMVRLHQQKLSVLSTLLGRVVYLSEAAGSKCGQNLSPLLSNQCQSLEMTHCTPPGELCLFVLSYISL